MNSIKKEPREDVARKQIQIYAAEKRLQFLLTKKFEMEDTLHPLLLGESEDIVNRYVQVFEVMERTLQQEIKYINERG